MTDLDARTATYGAESPVPATAAELLALYEQMALIRRTEKAAYDLFMLGLVKGTTHLAAGHDAVAVGASAALRPDDYDFATYRGHHHAMARGATAEECLAELMSKSTGLCRAKGGSMHLTKASAGRPFVSYDQRCRMTARSSCSEARLPLPYPGSDDGVHGEWRGGGPGSCTRHAIAAGADQRHSSRHCRRQPVLGRHRPGSGDSADAVGAPRDDVRRR